MIISPFDASARCAGLRSSINDPTALSKYKSCGTSKAIRAIWIGCIVTLLLLLISQFTSIDEADESSDEETKKRRQRLSYSIVIAPFILCVVYAFAAPLFAKLNYDYDLADFKTSNLTDKEWLNTKVLDDRTARSTSTSILCAFIIAGAGIFNTQWSYWYVALKKK